MQLVGLGKEGKLPLHESSSTMKSSSIKLTTCEGERFLGAGDSVTLVLPTVITDLEMLSSGEVCRGIKNIKQSCRQIAAKVYSYDKMFLSFYHCKVFYANFINEILTSRKSSE